MLTRQPINAGIPAGAVITPCRSVINNRLALEQLLVSIGVLVELATAATGHTQPDVAHWVGATLIRWAEQDRAELCAMLAAGDRRVA